MPAERAIEHKDQDALGRDQFVRRLTQALISPNTKKATGIAVGLTGSWGSGKSSILNLIQEYMAADWPNAIVVRFNPWLISSRNDLIKEFFGELRSAILKARGSNRDAEELLKTLVNYGDRLSPVLDFVPYGVVGRAVFRAGASALVKDKSLTALREKLLMDLGAFPNPVVVLIDEVDRVDNADILAIAQLVRSIADFPNVSYLLAYDPVRVSEALGGGSQERGRDYLEKIVQLQIPIPVITAEELVSVLRAELSRISEFNLPPDFWGIQRYIEFERLIAVRILSTLRDVRRLVGTFRSVFSMVQGEADWIDVLGYCVLLTKAPQVVNQLRDNMERVVADPLSDVELMRRATEKDKNADSLLSELVGDENHDSGIGALLKMLFTRFGILRPEDLHVDSISRRRTFLVVLRLGILPGGWSRDAIISFSKRSPDIISKDLHSLRAEDRLRSFTDRLGDVYGDLEGFDHVSFWLGAGSFSTRTPPSWATRDVGMLFDIRELGDLVLEWCKRSASVVRIAREMFAALKSAGNISLTSYFLHLHAFAHGLFGRDLRPNYGTFLSAEETTNETRELCEVWSQMHKRGELLASSWSLMPVFVMRAAGYWGDDARKLLAEEINNSNEALDGLSLMLFGAGYSTDRPSVEAIVGVAVFVARARSRLSDAESSLDETAAGSLRAALEAIYPGSTSQPA